MLNKKYSAIRLHLIINFSLKGAKFRFDLLFIMPINDT